MVCFFPFTSYLIKFYLCSSILPSPYQTRLAIFKDITGNVQPSQFFVAQPFHHHAAFSSVPPSGRRRLRRCPHGQNFATLTFTRIGPTSRQIFLFTSQRENPRAAQFKIASIHQPLLSNSFIPTPPSRCLSLRHVKSDPTPHLWAFDHLPPLSQIAVGASSRHLGACCSTSGPSWRARLLHRRAEAERFWS